jgi:hypothetical protein
VFTMSAGSILLRAMPKIGVAATQDCVPREEVKHRRRRSPKKLFFRCYERSGPHGRPTRETRPRTASRVNWERGVCLETGLHYCAQKIHHLRDTWKFLGKNHTLEERRLGLVLRALSQIHPDHRQNVGGDISVVECVYHGRVVLSEAPKRVVVQIGMLALDNQGVELICSHFAYKINRVRLWGQNKSWREEANSNLPRPFCE